MEHETLSRLFLELSQVVPPGTQTARELKFEARIEELRAALRRYGMHEVACCADDSPAECICGFDAALRGEEG